MEHIQKVRQNDAFSEDALDLVKYLVALFLDLWIALEHAAVNQGHADRSNLVDQRLRYGVEQELNGVDLQFKRLHA